ncbi:2769_t:CDS:2, partial [Ambispora leptoticha]
MSFNTTTLPSNSNSSRTQPIRRNPPNPPFKKFSTRTTNNFNINGIISPVSSPVIKLVNSPGSVVMDSDLQKKVDDDAKSLINDDNLINSKPFPLTNAWTFYLDKFVPNASPEEYQENLKSLGTVKTVQNFWSLYHYIPGPETLQLKNSLHFMKG